ncbi:amidohydrolase family protein [Sinorhizobium meliloti]|nr:amidohydrolase family protein [Sinorhizobium meliloti]
MFENSTPGELPVQCELIVHSGLVLTIDNDNRIINDGALAIGHGRILAIGSTSEILQTWRANNVLDAEGGVVHPGFIDAHVHVSQYTARSVLPRMARTAITMGDWKAALTPEDEHVSATLAAIDYLRSGYTGFVDPGTIFEPNAVAPVAKKVGIRIWLTDPYVADRGDRLRDHAELVSDSFLKRWPQNTSQAVHRMGSQLFRNRDSESTLVSAFIGLYGEETCSAELLEAASHLAQTHGVQMQQHLGYAPNFYHRRELALKRPVLEWLADRGWLAPNATFIHMNALSATDVQQIAGANAKIVWCPYGQLQMMSEAHIEPRTSELLDAGVAIGLGADIARIVPISGLGSLAMATAAAFHFSLQATALLRMRCTAAAATVGASDEIGSLEKGKRADIVVRSPRDSITLHVDVLHELAALGGGQVRHVIVAGQWVLRDGALEHVDESAALAAARSSVKAIAARIGLP